MAPRHQKPTECVELLEKNRTFRCHHGAYTPLMTAAPEPQPKGPPAPPERRCRCGHDKRHHMVSPRCEYSGLGWLLVGLIGISIRPKRVKFTCRVCGDVIESTTDPVACEAVAGSQ